MATEKKITSRIQQKHDVAANWAKATNFIPKKGEIIIYDAEYNTSGEETQAVRFKIGDGSKTVNNLPFVVIDYSSDIETLKQKVANNSTAIGALQENTVPKTRKINNKALSSDITLGAADVGVNETTFPGLKKTGTVTGVKMNGTTKNPSSGVVDLGTIITAHQSIKSLKTDNTESQAVNPNEDIVGVGDINLHKVSKTGSYSDLRNIPTDIAKIGNLSNPNLLINPNFAINQRGQTNYTASESTVYCVDRWYLHGSGTFDTSSKEVSLSKQYSLFWQSIENYNDLKGKTVTFSISVSNVRGNALYMKLFGGQDIHITTDGIYTVTTTLSTSITKFGCGLSRSTNVTGEASCVVNWAKLEIGSVATEFSPPNIAEEMPKCQRYYQIRSNSYTIETNAIDRPIPMRVNGTIGTTTINGTTYKYADAEI